MSSFPDLVPRALVTLTRRGVPLIGEREARLLEAVDRVRSIKDAASEAGISYRTAWSAIQHMEQALGRPMVVSRAGGPGGGATTLTDECRHAITTCASGWKRTWRAPGIRPRRWSRPATSAVPRGRSRREGRAARSSEPRHR